MVETSSTRGLARARSAALATVLAVVAALVSASPPAAAHDLDRFELVDVLGPLDQPTAVAFAPDGRVFVTEKRGVLKVFDRLGDQTAEVVLDLSHVVNDYLDRGLLGLEIDPGFATNPYLYLLYTFDAPPGQPAPFWNDDCQLPDSAGCPVEGRLVRIEVDAASRMVGQPQLLVAGWCQQYGGHSIGDLEFGPDGYLYASAGDGAHGSFVDFGQRGGSPCLDPPNEGGALRAQDLVTTSDPVGLSGTVIRIDPATGAAAPGNPRLGGRGDDDRVVAHGFRNPFRIAARPGTGELWVADVGWGYAEELNRIVDPTATVENFGWPCYEGPARQGLYDGSNIPLCEDIYDGTLATAVTAPFWDYGHGSDGPDPRHCGVGEPFGGGSISALAFYSGGNYPPGYAGAAFVGDYAQGCVWALPAGADGLPDPAGLETVAGGVFVVDLERGPGGDLFLVDIVTGVKRLRAIRGNASPTAAVVASPRSGRSPLLVAFDAGASTDPEGGALSYAWDFDGSGTYVPTPGPATTHTYRESGSYTARVRVTDVGGAIATAAVQIDVDNTAPVATITAPAPGLRWRAGQRIDFAGGATDEGVALGPEALTWTVLLHHCDTPTRCHVHTVSRHPGVATGSFAGPEHEFPSFVELVLEAEDALGAKASTSITLQPEAATLRLRTEPAGMLLVVGEEGAARSAPIDHPAIAGSTVSLAAVSPQEHNGVEYVFAGWSDGGAVGHDVAADDLTLTATFEPANPLAGVGLVDAASGRWTLRPAGGGEHEFFFGVPGDVPFVGDWDCDGFDSPGLYRQSDGFVYLRNTAGTGPADIEFFLGNPGDIPLAGDFNRDGCDSVGVYRPDEGRVFLADHLGADGGFFAADYEFFFGNPGDVPYSGDFDGDGIDDIGLHRATTGFVYFRLSHSSGVADFEFFYGDPGDTIVAGDWTGDGVDTVGIYRPGDDTFYLRHTNTLGAADEVRELGGEGRPAAVAGVFAPAP